MIAEKTTLKVNGQEYPAELALPDKGTDHGVVLVPGRTHGPFGDVFDRLAEALVECGIALFRYETWGERDDLDDLPDGRACNELFAEIDAAAKQLAGRCRSRIDVVGKSFGGRLVLRHVPEPADRIVLWAPLAFLSGGRVFEYEDVPDDEDLLIESEVLAHCSRPIDILQGDEDYVPVENAYELVGVLPNGCVHIIKGADHSFVGGKSEVETVEMTVELLTDAANEEH